MRINKASSDYKFNTIILAAGKGTRVREFSNSLPKPMMTINGTKAIDFLLTQFSDITNQFIICTGYKADILETYIKSNYPNKKIKFVRQKVSELAPGPGKSAILGLNATDMFNGTIFLFCDILFEDKLEITSDALGLCKPTADPKYVLDNYGTLGVVADGAITDIVKKHNQHES